MQISRTGSDNPARRTLQREGFSLVELVIVLLVMSLAVVVTYPSLSRGTASLNLKATGRDILSTFRFARERAITEQKGMIVMVDKEAQKVTMTDDVGDGARSFTMPHGIRIARLVSGGSEVLDGPLALRFMPNGSSQSGEILLVSDKGGALRVVTDPLTGGARVLEGAGESRQ